MGLALLLSISACGGMDPVGQQHATPASTALSDSAAVHWEFNDQWNCGDTMIYVTVSGIGFADKNITNSRVVYRTADGQQVGQLTMVGPGFFSEVDGKLYFTLQGRYELMMTARMYAGRAVIWVKQFPPQSSDDFQLVSFSGKTFDFGAGDMEDSVCSTLRI